MNRRLLLGYKQMRLSAKEQRLLDFAHERFGEHLSQFLLTGLGEEPVVQRCHFIINYPGDKSLLLKRHVEVITYEPLDGSSYLPRQRDPLVLLALLYLLLHGEESLNSLRYDNADVLSLLGRKGSRKTRREINDAINRYSLLTYRWKMNKSELARGRLAFFTANESLISEYQIIDYGNETLVQQDHALNLVVFNEHFVGQLLSRSLFGIDWNSVRSLSCRFSSKK